MSNNIFVTKPSLPPLGDYFELLESVWESGILTHNGPKVQLLEEELKLKLGVGNLAAVVNGTTALQLAIKALDLEGEIITTPFSWIATVSAIMWENCTPVFVDIDSETFNIDVEQIEKAITKKTSAILAVHVFSNPCELEKIQALADKYNLKIIYDAAHAMFVNYKGNSILSYGDISATSFHATKIFQSGEGGACVAGDTQLLERVKRLRFFGHDDNKEVIDYGMNGKMTELHAALGLSSLTFIDKVVRKRRIDYEMYLDLLGSFPGIKFQKFNPEEYNYSYMPIVFDDHKEMLQKIQALKEQNIYARRYFYPTLNKIPLLTDTAVNMVHAESISSNIICLPHYFTLREDHIKTICGVLLKN
jgi:dTDP-4-amino-4,6-dideoxygalactose transaminase